MTKYAEYQSQLQGLKAVHQTVKLVEKIAAAELRNSKKQEETLQKQIELLSDTIEQLNQHIPAPPDSRKNSKTQPQKILLLLTHDKGLVGGLANMLLNKSLDRVSHYQQVWIAGSRGSSQLQTELDKLTQKIHIFVEPLHQSVELHKAIKDKLSQEHNSTLDVVYLDQLSSVSQKIMTKPLFPVNLFSNTTIKQPRLQQKPVYEGNPEAIKEKLLSSYFSLQLQLVLNQSKQAELSTRMLASEHAAAKAETLVNTVHQKFVAHRRHYLTQQQLGSFAHLKTL